MNALNEAPQVVTDTGLWYTLLKSAAMLFIVLGILIAVLYVIKRLFYQQGHAGQGAIKMLATCHIAPKERLILVDVLGEKILLGSTPQSINSLAVIKNDLELCEKKRSSKPFFRNLLSSAVAKDKSPDKNIKPDHRENE